MDFAVLTMFTTIVFQVFTIAVFPVIVTQHWPTDSPWSEQRSASTQRCPGQCSAWLEFSF